MNTKLDTIEKANAILKEAGLPLYSRTVLAFCDITDGMSLHTMAQSRLEWKEIDRVISTNLALQEVYSQFKKT